MVRIKTTENENSEINLKTLNLETTKISCQNLKTELSPNIKTIDIKSKLENSYYMSNVAKTGDYNDLINKPTIPIVGNGTITIKQGEDVKGTFKTNQSGDTTIEVDAIEVPTPEWGDISGTLSNQTDLQNALNGKVNTSSLSTVATSGSYNDLTDKPTIPTVNNAVLTIQKNGTNVQTFTANASSNVTANILVPTKTSDLTNDSGFLTSATIPTHALKGYEDAGELLTDSEGLADVTNYAHSTFDISKFQRDGTPVVTNDGIYTPTSGNLFKLTSLSISSANEVKFRIAFKYYTGSTYRDIFSGLGMNYAPRLVINNNNTVSLYAYDGTVINTITLSASSFTNNTWYIIEWTLSNTNSSYKLYDINNNLISSGSQAPSTTLNINFAYALSIFRIGYSGGTTPIIFDSQIDLKQFSITVDGIPVFSGNKTGVDTYTINNSTVSIPYTLSKTGSKIVDSYYRSQVSAVYDELGYAPYYTLNEGTDFTIPQGEIYGMMVNKSTPHITETYVNGTSGYRVWSDGYCEQWGTLTATNDEQTITFLKPFANTNYFIVKNLGGTNTSTSPSDAQISFYDLTTTTATTTQATGLTSARWMAYGYIE